MAAPNVPNGLQLHASGVILADGTLQSGVNILGVNLVLPAAMDITLGTEIDPSTRIPVALIQVAPGGFFVVLGYDPAFDTATNIRIVSSADFVLGPINYTFALFRMDVV